MARMPPTCQPWQQGQGSEPAAMVASPQESWARAGRPGPQSAFPNDTRVKASNPNLGLQTKSHTLGLARTM